LAWPQRQHALDPPQFYQVPFSYHRIDPIKDALDAADFTDLRIAVLRVIKIIPDVPSYARAVVLGNPLIGQIRARGGVGVGLLDIDGQKVSYAQVDGKNYDMATGLNPLNVQITPDGKLAIVNNIGSGQDGQVDTVGVIDLEASPPRVIDQVVVGDGPEGLAISPAGGEISPNFGDGLKDQAAAWG
jgi:hypothetical protein